MRDFFLRFQALVDQKSRIVPIGNITLKIFFVLMSLSGSNSSNQSKLKEPR